MKVADYLPWYEELLRRFGDLERYVFRTYEKGGSTAFYDPGKAQARATEAGSALEALFPPNHVCRRTWERLALKLNPEEERGGGLEEMFGVITAATQQLRDNRIGSILDAVRVETGDDLLEQATELLRADYRAASAVIAGRALEVHLRHLAVKNGLNISGAGSISSYNDAISQARNAGTVTVYHVTDGKQITAWGGIRNEAAHDLGVFNRTKDEVQRMIDGIREFISRTA
jgi:hypothetical protein